MGDFQKPKEKNKISQSYYILRHHKTEKERERKKKVNIIMWSCPFWRTRIIFCIWWLTDLNGGLTDQRSCVKKYKAYKKNKRTNCFFISIVTENEHDFENFWKPIRILNVRMIGHLQVIRENKITAFLKNEGLNMLWINVAEEAIRGGWKNMRSKSNGSK